ncbi:MAG TPA: hypothetical protein VFJ82_01085 [Longimicrobium sp.]|nr:hypothetical protein [Longimicrobium sp.]
MLRTSRTLAAMTAALLCAACADGLTGSQQDDTDLATAFTSSLLGFSATSSSFDTSAGGDSAFVPHGGHDGHHGGHGRGGLPGGHDFMGGGFGIDFLGGPGDGHRPFDDRGFDGTCTYDAASGTSTCTATHNGLTINRTAKYLTAAGAAQQALDSLTNTVITHVAVTGTTTRRDSVTTTVNHTSDRTVTGLARGSTQRTVNGASQGTENSTGANSTGSFTASRTAADSIIGVVVPVADGRPSYPTAGRVVRSMTATLTYTGQTPATKSRREVITYDGSATATLVITQDGTTRTCTIPLPHGRPTCS